MRRAGFLVFGTCVLVTACSDIIEPTVPDTNPARSAPPLAPAFNQASHFLKSLDEIACTLRVRRPNGTYRSKTVSLTLPKNVRTGPNLSRQFVYQATRRGDTEPIRMAICTIPATTAALDWIIQGLAAEEREQTSQTSSMTAQSTYSGVMPQTECDPPLTAQQPATSGVVGTDPLALCECGDPPMAARPYAITDFGGTVAMDVLVEECDNEGCDPFFELDWECECDGPGLTPNPDAPPECDDWGDDEEDPPGGGGGGPILPPTGPPPGIDPADWETLNAAEKARCREKPIECSNYIFISKTAVEWAKDRRDQNGVDLPGRHNGPQDAVQHAYWAASLRVALGLTSANAWLQAHETSSCCQDETQMDMHNNSVGLAIGAKYHGLPLAQYSVNISADVMQAYQQSQLTWLPSTRWED